MNEEQFSPFYINQPKENRDYYIKLLRGAVQTSILYSENDKPYLPYRAAEKIFCKAFRAQDVSRKDISVDAIKNQEGIGIKTFITGGKNGKFEKIAEFVDRVKYPLSENNPEKLIKEISEYRNSRIEEVRKEFDLRNIVYHSIVRAPGKMYICEQPLSTIKTNNLTLQGKKGANIYFKDTSSKYLFSLSKHTLYTHFFYDSPFEEITINKNIEKELLSWTIQELSSKYETKKELLKKYEYVLLPLYSTRLGDVPEKSGLNQWNAGGRERNPNEVYIPIPRVVHVKKPNFFPPKDQKFILQTDDGYKFKAKVCQDGSKALMTDHNKDLGEWILRKILKIQEGEKVTLAHLQAKNADTVIIYKISEDTYLISLDSFGSFAKEYT